MSDQKSDPPEQGRPARVGRVAAPVGALRRGAVVSPRPLDLEAPQVEASQAGAKPAKTPAVSRDMMVRAARKAPSENRLQVVFAVAMLLLGALTGVMFEPQWRNGQSILPAPVINLVKAVPGLGAWFAASLNAEPANAQIAQTPLPKLQPAVDEFLPNLLLELSPEAAKRMNEVIPVAAVRGPPAPAFSIPQTDLELRRRAVQCLTAAVYYEAGNETPQGQAAVAQVVLNRMRHPAYPKSVCGVVFEGSERKTGCQFTFTCDGSLRRVPDPVRWRRAQGVAEAALNGAVEPSVGLATHYHADYVVPKWARQLTKARVIGAHIFYRWNGGWGEPGAFRGVYAAVEQTVPGLWPVDALGGDLQLAEASTPLPDAALTLASLDRVAPTGVAETVAAVAPVIPAPPPPQPVEAAPVLTPQAPAPVTSAPQPKQKQREPGARPRIPVPSNW